MKNNVTLKKPTQSNKRKSQNLEALTWIECCCSDDWELSAYGKCKLELKYGKDTASKIFEAISENNYEKMPLALLDFSNKDIIAIKDIFKKLNKSSEEKNSYKMSEKAIMRLYHASDKLLISKSKEQMINLHFAYIYSLIHSRNSKYKAQYMDDFFNAGVLGLLEAMEKYNGRYKFTTYSKWFILHQIILLEVELEGNHSLYYAILQRDIKNSCEELNNQGKEIIAELIADDTGFSLEIVKRELEIIQRGQTEYIDGWEEGWKDIVDERANTEDVAVSLVCAKELGDLISRLGEKERMIVILRDIEEKTWKKLEDVFGESTYKIRRWYNSIKKQLQDEAAALGYC